MAIDNASCVTAAIAAGVTPTAALFRSLGDETRLRIVARLAAGEARVVDLTGELGLAQSTVFQAPGLPARLRPGRLPRRGAAVVLRANPAGADGPAASRRGRARRGRRHGSTTPGLRDRTAGSGGMSGGGHGHGPPSAGHRRPLAVVLCISGTILAVEVIGAFVSGSLALLADAGHMLTDVAGLSLALVAAVLAAPPGHPGPDLGVPARRGPGRRRAGRGAARGGRVHPGRGDPAANRAIRGGLRRDDRLRHRRAGSATRSRSCCCPGSRAAT